MKTIKLLLIAIAAVGFTLVISKCKKDPPVVVETYTISGDCTYPDYNSTMVAAPGAILSIYAGSDSTALATTFADANGAYHFDGLLPGDYVVEAKYNTDNQNAKAIEGINFEVNYSVTLGAADYTQDVVLETIAATSTTNITITASDTTGSLGALKYAAMEAHSQTTWWIEHIDSDAVGMTLAGGFPAYAEGSSGKWIGFQTFRFDEANPANIYFKAYVITSGCYTANKGRDTVRAGCVDTYWSHDTVGYSTGQYATVLPQTDTAFYWVEAGDVERYGSGYLAHGVLAPVWKHQGGEIVAPRVTALTPDTTLAYAGSLGWNVRIQSPVDMYFEYQGKKKVWNSTHTTFNWYFEFEGEFQFRRSTFFMKASLGDVATVTPHMQFKGSNNVEY